MAEEVAQTLFDALRADVRAESREAEYWTYYGLNSLIAEFIRRRDVTLAVPSAPILDPETFRRSASALLQLTSRLANGSPGSKLLRALAAVVDRLRNEDDPVVLHRELSEWPGRLKRLKKGRTSPPMRLGGRRSR
jgi:hypothetical protein